MTIAIIGGNCVGKSSLADALKVKLNATVYSGRDYLRLAKNEQEARQRFKALLSEAMQGDHVIYVISEPSQLALLPDGAFRILVTAELELIKERFARRTGGKLPAPVEAMLERNHGCFDSEPCDLHLISPFDTDAVCAEIVKTLR
ncbi:MAG: hypothetical protein IKM04_01480 [Clostridia bacterium]|nr:hypothetical protein [Clostridia bacterium]